MDSLRRRRHLPGPMTILRDKGDGHDHAKAVRASLASRPDLATELLPRDAPEANPDEGVWGQAKDGRLANSTPEDRAELRSILVEEFNRIHRRPALLAASIRHTGVPIRLRC